MLNFKSILNRKAKMILACICVLAITSGVFAFKAQRSGVLFCADQSQQACPDQKVGYTIDALNGTTTSYCTSAVDGNCLQTTSIRTDE
jgi:hypothetical protein